jgi:hypothetical protein
LCLYTSDIEVRRLHNFTIEVCNELLFELLEYEESMVLLEAFEMSFFFGS